MTFVQAVKEGIATIDEIYDWVDRWHESPADDGPLHEYLGLSREQYGLWVQTPSTLEASVREQIRTSE